MRDLKARQQLKLMGIASTVHQLKINTSREDSGITQEVRSVRFARRRSEETAEVDADLYKCCAIEGKGDYLPIGAQRKG